MKEETIYNPTLKQVKRALRAGGVLYLQTAIEGIAIKAQKTDFLDTYRNADNTQKATDYNGESHQFGCVIETSYSGAISIIIKSQYQFTNY